MRTPLVLFLLLCLAGVVQAETTLTVSRKVVMPDGTPAANAKVTLRTFTANGLVQELVTQTGADGTIEATMKYEPAADPFAGNTSAGYMMVDVAGCALAFGRLTPKAGTPTGTGMRPGRHGSGGGGVGGGGGLPLPGGGSSSTGGDTTLKLLAAYQQTGTVVDGETKAPVPGAKVMVTGFNGGVGVNLGWAGFHTPELMTTADDKGAFILRGTTAESLGGMGLPMMSSWPVSTVIAMGTVNGHTEAGGNEHFCFNNPRRTDQQVLLGSTMALEGTVKDGDGHPVAGVSVRLRGIPSYWVYSMPAAVTDANGVYEFPLLATTYRIYVLASKPGYAGSFVQAADIVPRHGEPTVVPDKITAPPLTVRPMGPAITVRVLDEKTGQPPLPLMRLLVTLNRGIHDDDLGWIGNDAIWEDSQQGLITITLPVGQNSGTVGGAGYRGQVEVDVPAKGVITATVQRQTGLLLHFTTANPKGITNCWAELHGGDGKVLSGYGTKIDENGFFFYIIERQTPPGPYQVHVRRGAEEACPWTDIKAETWPNEIDIK